MSLVLSGDTGVSGNSGALIAGTTVASTSGTSIDFTSIPSWVKRITVMFADVSVSGTSNYLVQIGSGSVTTSGYSSTSTFTLTTSSVGGGLTSTSGFILQASAASYLLYGLLTITKINGNVWVANGVLGNLTTTAYTTNTTGVVTLGGTLDRVRITTVNGTDTFDAGSINILYE